MMRVISFFAICFLSQQAMAQHQTGFYLTVPCSDLSKVYTERLGERSACIPDLPFIAADGFEEVSKIGTSGKKIYFEIKLNSKAYNKIRQLASTLHDTSLALVIRDELFFIVSSGEIKAAGYYRFFSDASNYTEVQNFHSSLVEDTKKIK